MLTGRRPFPGEDVSDVLASVLAREPQLAAIPDAVPSTVRHVLKACLQKDPKKRIHDMGDVRLAMSGVFETVRDADAPAVDSASIVVESARHCRGADSRRSARRGSGVVPEAYRAAIRDPLQPSSEG